MKVFASDFDGTLYFYKGATEAERLPPVSVETIRRYQAAGHLFGLCTGRQVGGLTPFIGGILQPDFYITSSGANIVGRELEPILKRGVDRSVADALIREYNPKGCRMTLDIEGEICVFANAPDGLIHQVSIHTESLEDAAAIVETVNERFGDFVQAFQNVVEVDIAPRGCSKGKGVLYLRDYMKQHWGTVKLYGIGDSMNDLPLLDAADVSYTFPYAPELVQKRATKVVPTIVDALLDSMNDD